jgi:GxxExxY protein
MDQLNPALNDLTRRIIGAGIAVHRELGPGLLESAYEECLSCELEHIGLAHRRQVPLPVTYRGRLLDCAYRLDIVVEDSVILELKALDKVLPIHEAQLLTYLRLARKPIGLIINFNVPVLKDGITRRLL